MQIPMISSGGMSVKCECLSYPWIVIGILLNNFSGKFKQIFGVDFLVVHGFKIDTKNFGSSYVSVCKADKIVLKGRQPQTHFLCTLQVVIPGLVPTAFTCRCVSLDMLLKSANLL